MTGSRSWFARHKILTAIGALLVLGVIGNLSKQGGNRPQSDGSGSRPDTKAATSAETDVVISAVELSAAFKENELRANKAYKGRLAEIEGEVHRVDEVFGRTILTLKGAPWAPAVSCTLADKSFDDRIAELDAGAPITMIGTIHGKTLSVDVKKCVLK